MLNSVNIFPFMLKSSWVPSLLSFYLLLTSCTCKRRASRNCPPTSSNLLQPRTSNYWGWMWSRLLYRLIFSPDNCLERLMSFTVSTDAAVLAKKLLIWHFHCLSSRGERQRVPATPQGFWVTVSVGVFKTPADLLLLSGLETNGLLRAYFICTCGGRAERKWEALEGSALDVFN